jgi:hypothetical protein
MVDVRVVLAGLVPLMLALVRLARFGVAKYRSWRNAREGPPVWFDVW